MICRYNKHESNVQSRRRVDVSVSLLNLQYILNVMDELVSKNRNNSKILEFFHGTSVISSDTLVYETLV